MSRRKQSNPKSIKVTADSAESEDTEKDADVNEMMSIDPEEDDGLDSQDQEMKPDASRFEPRKTSRQDSATADSPDHIDVVNTFHSPSRHNSSSSPPPHPLESSKSPPPAPGSSPPPGDRVVVKVEREEGEDEGGVHHHHHQGRHHREDSAGRGHHHGNDTGNNSSGSPNAERENPMTQGLVRHLQLPSDVLYLKELVVNMHGKPTPSWMICSAIPLPKGSSLGPFAGDIVSSDNVRVGDLIVEFHSKTGHVALVSVAGHSGAWLALLRPAVNGITRNTLVYLEGGRIWCEIVSDVEIGMELRATFVFDMEDLSLADRELSTAPLSPVPSTPDRSSSSASPPVQQSAAALQQASPPGHAALIYGCPFCGVRFSSPRTLQGHLSYYCSKKRSEHIVCPRPKSRRGSDNSQGSLSLQSTDMARLKQEGAEEAADTQHKNINGGDHVLPRASPPAGKPSGGSLLGKKRPAAMTTSSTGISSDPNGSPPLHPPAAKSACLDSQVFQCPLCSYRADKLTSLNRHMRIHNNNNNNNNVSNISRPLEAGGAEAAASPSGSASSSSSSSTAAPGGPAAPSNSATYCKECHIQFSSLSTFRCHKEHYCSQRRGPSNEGKPRADTPQFAAPHHPHLPHHHHPHHHPHHPHASLGELSPAAAAPLQLASLGQGGGGAGMYFPAGQAMVSEAAAGAAVMPGGQATVILTAPVMTPSGLTSMAIPLPNVLVQSIHHAAVAAAAHAAAVGGAPVSPRAAAVSPRKSSSSSSSSTPPPSHPKASDFTARSSSVAPEEAHQSKSPKASSSSDSGAGESFKELPLDLSKKKPGGDGERDRSGSADEVLQRSTRIKKEKDDEMASSSSSPVASARSASRSSPAADGRGGRSSSSEGLDHRHRANSSSPTTTPSVHHPHAHPAHPAPHHPPPPLLNPSLLQGFLPMHSMAAVAAATAGMTGLPVAPQGFGAIPPGVSKCTDCNIIFYKHDNFLIHKQHYCSGQKLRGGAAATATPVVSPRAESDLVKTETTSATVTSSSANLDLKASSGQSSHINAAARSHLSATQAQKLPARAPPPALVAASAGMEDVYYKFFCIPCKIKFSSASNLKAHKEYYCPHGKNSEHTVIVQTPSGEIVGAGAGAEPDSLNNSNGSSPSPGQYFCSQCRSVFSSSRLLKIHLCSGEETQASLLRCSHCDYVTHTDKRLAEHMKVHNPTSAYRCTLCGYRGNTMRGMRMHGKSHTDNGEDFTESHMVEFQEPPLVPIQTNNEHKGVAGPGGGPVSMEAELLRLKNEPYKRRRSRKAYEKVDILVPLDDHTCQLCGECFPDPRSLAIHFRIHEIASQYMQELVRCSQCDFVTKNMEELRAHMDISHAVIPREEKENHPDPTSPDRIQSRKSFERGSSLDKKSPVRIKEEPVDKDYDEHRSSSVHVKDRFYQNDSESQQDEPYRGAKLSKENGGHVASQRSASRDTNDEKSNGDSAEDGPGEGQAVRVKIEPGLDGDGDSSNDPPLPITFATPPSPPRPRSSATPPSPASRRFSSSNSQGCPDQGSPASLTRASPPVIVKQESMVSSHIPEASLFPRFHVASPASVDLAGTSAQKRNGVKEMGEGLYCHNCDISFTYRATFVAHKEHYCRGRGGATTATA